MTSARVARAGALAILGLVGACSVVADFSEFVPGADAGARDVDSSPPGAEDAGTDACSPERCNGEDDDCDGMTDEGFECLPGESERCMSEGCAGSGTRTCSEMCAWSTCAIDERCDRMDNDCDGAVDEGLLAAGDTQRLAVGNASGIDALELHAEGARLFVGLHRPGGAIYYRRFTAALVREDERLVSARVEVPDLTGMVGTSSEPAFAFCHDGEEVVLVYAERPDGEGLSSVLFASSRFTSRQALGPRAAYQRIDCVRAPGEEPGVALVSVDEDEGRLALRSGTYLRSGDAFVAPAESPPIVLSAVGISGLAAGVAGDRVASSAMLSFPVFIPGGPSQAFRYRGDAASVNTYDDTFAFASDPASGMTLGLFLERAGESVELRYLLDEETDSRTLLPHRFGLPPLVANAADGTFGILVAGEARATYDLVRFRPERQEHELSIPVDDGFGDPTVFALAGVAEGELRYWLGYVVPDFVGREQLAVTPIFCAEGP